eukprot:CAMPEP_0172741336 /NCGR_PEP_ID=MMETSP1074-20121228/127000_1 /TAXON_ID=2916 /ORGANISM="Ceratium fusus, Strain PA161109" /LENGTH=71 /DNA_ID=CAMNT_0013571631 /DNA_START=254 /DNA_END=467 /DNA_ORIENTATION=+
MLQHVLQARNAQPPARVLSPQKAQKWFTPPLLSAGAWPDEDEDAPTPEDSPGQKASMEQEVRAPFRPASEK